MGATMRYPTSYPARVRPDRRGFALPLMLAVLALGSILVAATFLMARLEAQSGENTLGAMRAAEAAESGLAEMVSWWDPLLYDTMSVGSRMAVPSRTLSQGGYQGAVTRLSGPLFLVQSEGWYAPPPATLPARRALSVLVRLTQPDPAIKAALTVRDTVLWDAPSTISGQDSIPGGWSARCPIPDSAVAGIRHPPSIPPVLGSCGGPPCLSGNPPVTADSTIADSTLRQFGVASYAGLAVRATRVVYGSIAPIGPSLLGVPPGCDLADSLNWGEPQPGGPFALCSGFFPVIHATGDLMLTGGRGQGILLVDGSLTIAGGTQFTGLVVVLGTLRNGAGGGSILGATLATNVSLDTTGGPLLINYSACVLPYSLRGSSMVTPLPYRSWAQEF